MLNTHQKHQKYKSGQDFCINIVIDCLSLLVQSVQSVYYVVMNNMHQMPKDFYI